jgi:hypothetical protein
MSLIEKIKSNKHLFKTPEKSCLYLGLNPKTTGIAEELIWFYCRMTKCEVYTFVSKDVAKRMFETSWANVSDDFTYFIEQELFPFCAENTEWDLPDDYEELSENEKDYAYDDNKPFGSGDFTYGLADEDDFVFED